MSKGLLKNRKQKAAVSGIIPLTIVPIPVALVRTLT